MLSPAESASKWWLDSEQILVGAYYRCGQFQRAIDQVPHAAKVSALKPSTLFFIAMTQQRLGKNDEARSALTKAIHAMGSGGGWHEEISNDLLRQEAEALILDAEERPK